jgi:hypothetical protein
VDGGTSINHQHVRIWENRFVTPRPQAAKRPADLILASDERPLDIGQPETAVLVMIV